MNKSQNSPVSEDKETFYISDESDQDANSEDSGDSQLSHIIKLSFLDLMRYSQSVRSKIFQNDIISCLTNELQSFQSSYNIKNENIEIFFKLLKKEKIDISSSQYCDLYRLSELFQVEPLKKLLKGYLKRHSNNIDLIINLMIDQIYSQNNDLLPNNEISIDMEECLYNNIEKCIVNQNFNKLPVSTVYRIFEKSDMQKISSDVLYDFISKSADKRFSLLQFLDIRNLSDENFNGLYQLFESQKYSGLLKNYLPVDLNYIKYLRENSQKLINQIRELKEDNKTKLNQLSELSAEKDKLQNQNNELSAEKDKLQNQNNELSAEKDKLQNQNSELSAEKDKLQNQNNELSAEKDKLQNQNNELSAEKDKLQNQNNELSAEKDKLQNQNNELSAEKDKLQNQNNELSAEKDKLQNQNNELSAEKDKLQNQNNELSAEKDKLQNQNNELSAEKDKLQNNKLSSKNRAEKEFEGYFEIIKGLSPHIEGYFEIVIYKTIFHIACEFCIIELAEYLLAHTNIDINLKDIHILFYIKF